MNVKIENDKETIGPIELKEKQFKSGKEGYHGYAQKVIDGKVYRVNILLIEMG